MKTAIVFVHGFLGTGADWSSVQNNRILQTYGVILAPTLPGHGHIAAPLPDSGLTGMARWLANHINDIGYENVVLAGYSLGGRILLSLASQIRNGQSNLAHPETIKGMVIESAHPGLAEEEKPARRQWDSHWSGRFRTESLASVLDQWYQQPVFSDISKEERVALVAKRKIHDPGKLSEVLLHCSLADQSDFWPVLLEPPFPVHYWFGQRDRKYQNIADRLINAQKSSKSNCFMSRLCNGQKLTIRGFSRAGHNCHLADPAEYTRQLRAVLSDLVF